MRLLLLQTTVRKIWYNMRVYWNENKFWNSWANSAGADVKDYSDGVRDFLLFFYFFWLFFPLSTSSSPGLLFWWTGHHASWSWMHKAWTLDNQWKLLTDTALPLWLKLHRQTVTASQCQYITTTIRLRPLLYSPPGWASGYHSKAHPKTLKEGGCVITKKKKKTTLLQCQLLNIEFEHQFVVMVPNPLPKHPFNI